VQIKYSRKLLGKHDISDSVGVQFWKTRDPHFRGKEDRTRISGIDINTTTNSTKMSGKVLLFDLQDEVATDPVFLVLVLVDSLATSFFA
jgi:hypothetical protein